MQRTNDIPANIDGRIKLHADLSGPIEGAGVSIPRGIEGNVSDERRLPLRAGEGFTDSPVMAELDRFGTRQERMFGWGGDYGVRVNEF